MRCLIRLPILLALLAFPPALPEAWAASPHRPNEAVGGKHGELAWADWSPVLFERAAKEGKYVLLHLGANWCHWCHVMEETTYRDPAVLALIDKKFIPVRVEQDAHPELSQRYEAFGWPATIMFDAEGQEIGKRRGYQPPERFAVLLQAVIDDPSALNIGRLPLDDAPVRTALTPERRAVLEKELVEMLDFAQGGVGDVHRFIHAEATELGLTQGKAAGRDMEAWARLTLAKAAAIHDPVWGGVYQYSDTLDWSSPHYEKLLSSQVHALRLYSLAHRQQPNAAYRKLAEGTYRYLMDVMRDGATGAFYPSQDADLNKSVSGKQFYALSDAERRKLGQPRIDTSLYAREAGWGIQALLAWYDLSADAEALVAAERAARWALAQRRLPDGSFGHGAARDAEANLGDTLAMGEALLALYRATGGRDWYAAALETGMALSKRFRDPRGGYFVRAPEPAARGALREPVRPIEDNAAAARLLNRLGHYSGQADFVSAAQHGFAYLAALAEHDLLLPGALLAANELERPPLHVTIVGPKSDPAAQALHKAARALPVGYMRLDWWDRAEGAMPNDDVRYPALDQAAAFVCTDKVCSLPIFEWSDLRSDVQRFANLN